jgi:hypothetical protein
MTTNNTTTATLNNDLLSYLKGAEVGMAIVAINLRGAADLDGELHGMAEVVGTIRGLLGELIEDLVERMDADQAVEDAIAEVNAEAEAYAEADAAMREAAGAAVMEAMDDREMGWDTRKNPGAFSEALASDSDELASEEAARLKAADEAVVEAMRERLLENAAWAAVNPDMATRSEPSMGLFEKSKEANMAEFEAAEAAKAKQVQESLLPPTPGFVLDVLWIGMGEPTKEEIDQLVEGNIGAVSAKVATVPPHYFEENEDDFVEAACKEACSWDHDIIAGDFSADQALQLGIAVAQDEEPYGVRFAVRKDGGGFRIFMV